MDHAVVPAGGVHCRHCGTGACRVHGGHLAGCRNGMCDPHCPVRPSQYGFYQTQWRRWPGQGIVPVSAEEAATPVAPPASQVPTVDEESPGGAGATREAGDMAADAMPAVPDGPVRGGDVPADEGPARSGQEAPGARPGDEMPVPPTPPGDAPVPPGTEAAEGDIFDQSAVPVPEPEMPPESGAMRYPVPVGRSLVAGIQPWRLAPRGGQRETASARGR